VHDAADATLGSRPHGQHVAIVADRVVVIRKMAADVWVLEIAGQALLQIARESVGVAPRLGECGGGGVRDFTRVVDATPDLAFQAGERAVACGLFFDAGEQLDEFAGLFPSWRECAHRRDECAEGGPHVPHLLDFEDASLFGAPQRPTDVGAAAEGGLHASVEQPPGGAGGGEPAAHVD